MNFLSSVLRLPTNYLTMSAWLLVVFPLQLIPRSQPQSIHLQANLALPVTKSRISLHFWLCVVKVSIEPIKTLTHQEEDCHKAFCVHLVFLWCTALKVSGMGLKWCKSVSHQRYPSRFSLDSSSLHLGPLSACKLHLYLLKRDLMLYQGSRFFVDWFHWHGHVGCSQGYCFDSYESEIADVT